MPAHRLSQSVILPWRALLPMTPPYLFLVGLSFQLAYWSQFGVSVLEYADLADLIKLSLHPFMFALQPIAVIMIALLWCYRWARPWLEPRPDDMPVFKISNVWTRGALKVFIVAVAAVVGLALALGLFFVMNGAIRNEGWSWLLLGCIVAVAIRFPPAGCSLASLRRFGRGRIALSRAGMAWLALFPFLFYGLGLRSAEVALQKYESSFVDQLLAVPPTRCAILPQEGEEPAVVRFLGHVNEYDFFLFDHDVIGRRADATELMRFTTCGR